MTVYENLSRVLGTYGVLDFLLPFVLVFTIIYAILTKVPILGPASGNKKFNIIIALSLGLLFVIPHVTGTYPPGYDPVQIMNESLPSISLVGVAVLMVMILLGVFSRSFGDFWNPIIAFVSLGFVIYIFGSSLGLWNAPNDIFSWWSEETTELMLMIAVFGLIVWLVTRTSLTEQEKTAKKTARTNFFNDLLRRHD